MEREYRKSVLVLEDDIQWQSVVKALLLKVDKSLSIEFVASSEHAMNLINGGASYDLIVADQNLEGASTGLDFYRFCKLAKVPASFVMLSGLTEERLESLAGEVERPLFASKIESLVRFSELVESRFSSAQFCALPLNHSAMPQTFSATNVTAPAHADTELVGSREKYFVMLIIAAAAAYGLSTPYFSVHSIVSPQNVNASTLAIPQVVRAPASSPDSVLLASTPLPEMAQTKHSILTLGLKTQMHRILKRADEIEKTVAAAE